MISIIASVTMITAAIIVLIAVLIDENAVETLREIMTAEEDEAFENEFWFGKDNCDEEDTDTDPEDCFAD